MSSATCTSLTCGQLQKLIEKVEELNRTQTEAISSIKNLTNKLSELHFESVRGSSSLVLPTYNAVRGSDQPTRSYGSYNNWQDNYYFLKNQVWMNASIFENYCESIEQWGDNRHTSFTHLTDIRYAVSIHRTKRFPTPHLYIDINDPKVAYEILLLKNFRITATHMRRQCNELLKDFLKSVKSNMHTRSSFEEKYKLQWVVTSHKIK